MELNGCESDTHIFSIDIKLLTLESTSDSMITLARAYIQTAFQTPPSVGQTAYRIGAVARRIVKRPVCAWARCLVLSAYYKYQVGR